jgi:DNA polymerase elongation subunit (family B)
MTGWNFEDFDWTYIMTRCKKLHIDVTVCSPIREMKGNIPVHFGVFDYAKLFDKYDRSIGVKENNTLDFVSKEVLGVKKVSYNGTLQELYDNDFKKYVFYNIIDSILVLLIDKKQDILNLIFTLSNLCKIQAYKSSSPVVMTEALLSKGFYDRNMVIPRVYTDAVREPFDGAFVKEPISGYYTAIACFDFASLYPTIMRQMNISPESFIGKINKDEIDEARKDLSQIVATSGAVFYKEDSVLKTVLSDLYAQRKVYKNRYLEIQEELGELEKQLK